MIPSVSIPKCAVDLSREYWVKTGQCFQPDHSYRVMKCPFEFGILEYLECIFCGDIAIQTFIPYIWGK